MKKVKRLLLFGVIAFFVGTVTILNESTEMLGFFLMLAGLVLLLVGGVLAVREGTKRFKNKNKISGNTRQNLSNISDEENNSSSSKVSPDKIKCNEFAEELASLPCVEIARGPKIKRRKNALLAEITPSNITKRSRIDKLFPFVVIDTETTGLSPKDCEIIEVSAIKYDQNFTPVSCFSTLCKPSGLIPKSASDVNNITDAMVSNAPSFSEVAGKFMEYIAGCNIVGHNVKFDVKFLYVNGVDFSEEIRYYDTLDLAKKVLRAKSSSEYDPVLGKYVPCTEYDVLNYKLDTLCEYYGIYRDNAHRSLSDCLATGKLFECLVRAKHDT